MSIGSPHGYAAEVGQFRAVVAGVTDYRGDLTASTGEPFALGTAARRVEGALRDYARRLGYPPEAIKTVLLVDDDQGKIRPDRRNILNELTNAAVSPSGPSDMLVFYFTGHGSRDPRGMFLYASGSDDIGVTDRLELAYVADAMRVSRAGTKLVFIDACQVPKAGLAPSRSAVLDAKELASLKVQGTAWFFASEENEIAYLASNGIGFFTNELLSLLPRISPTELRYVDDLAQKLRENVSHGVAADATKRRIQYPYTDLSGVGSRFDLFRQLRTDAHVQVTPPSTGLRMTVDAKKGERLLESMLDVPLATPQGEDGVRPYDYQRDVKGSCLSRAAKSGSTLEWDDLALCP